MRTLQAAASMELFFVSACVFLMPTRAIEVHPSIAALRLRGGQSSLDVHTAHPIRPRVASMRPQPVIMARASAIAASNQSDPSELEGCVPQCSWQCESPKCDQVCEPECQPARCETRCQAADTSSCKMKCDVPQCAVVCPQRECAAKTGACDSCRTQCSEPMCMLSCPGVQPCTNVCEQPICDWRCREPTVCAKPLCRMVCDAPRSCSRTSFHATLPPKKDDEIAVQSFRASQAAKKKAAPAAPQQFAPIPAAPQGWQPAMPMTPYPQQQQMQAPFRIVYTNHPEPPGQAKQAQVREAESEAAVTPCPEAEVEAQVVAPPGLEAATQAATQAAQEGQIETQASVADPSGSGALASAASGSDDFDPMHPMHSITSEAKTSEVGVAEDVASTTAAAVSMTTAAVSTTTVAAELSADIVVPTAAEMAGSGAEVQVTAPMNAVAVAAS